VPQKISTKSFSSGSNTPDVSFSFSFCPWRPGTPARAFSLKQQRCPRCGCNETLNRHSVLYGNDPAQASGRVARGQRVVSTNRGQREGCGGTFSLFPADILPRHNFTATLLWQLLCALLAEASMKRAAQSLAAYCALETCGHLLHRLRRRLDAVRCRLCLRQKAPESSQSDPLLQTVEHLQSVFPHRPCPLSEWQLAFQQPLLG
jgi:hypothetical protein